MTYCLGIICKEGIVGLSDTRITSGTDTTTAKKVYTVNRENHSFFIMTSGLRSVRDKAITYFGEVVKNEDQQFKKLYEAVNKFGEQVKRVAREDKESLEESGLEFNLRAIVGGQFEEDDRPRLFLLYPQGNWIEVSRGTPFVIIGNTGFGTPVLKRSINFDVSLDFALKAGFLSFDATRISANDVHYPLDSVIMRNNEFRTIENRFTEKDLSHISEFWNSRLTDAINNMPAEALNKAFDPDLALPS